MWKFWKKKEITKDKNFRETIEDNLNGVASVLYVSAHNVSDHNVSAHICNEKFIVKTKFKKTDEEYEFIKSKGYWYTVPEMEQLAHQSKLRTVLDHIKSKYDEGLYEAIKPPNSVRFATED